MLLLRLLVLALGSIVVGGAIAVAVAYGQAYRAGNRLFPRHVVPMASSYVLMVLTVVANSWFHSSPAHCLWAAFALVIGLYGLVVILGAA